MFFGSLPAPTYGAVEYMEKEMSDKLFFHATNRFYFIFFFSFMQLDKIFYVNLHVSKNSLKYLKQKNGRSNHMRINTSPLLGK